MKLPAEERGLLIICVSVDEMNNWRCTRAYFTACDIVERERFDGPARRMHTPLRCSGSILGPAVRP